MIGVHGFGFKPGSKTNDPQQLFSDWSAMLATSIDGFAWNSSESGLASVFGAWSHGYLDRYGYAYKVLALKAAADLRTKLLGSTYPTDIICHSLGSRVVLQAIKGLPQNIVRDILILDGAELQEQVPMNLPRDTRILNVVVQKDLVLKELGSTFNDIDTDAKCIGQAGVGSTRSYGWTEVWLDDPQTQAAAKKLYGWDLDASPRHTMVTGNLITDLRNLGNHWASYQNPCNHELYREFFKGNPLEGILK